MKKTYTILPFKNFVDLGPPREDSRDYGMARFAPKWPAAVQQPPAIPTSGYLDFETWVACRPRFLFVDPCEGLIVDRLLIGDRVCFAADGEIPAKVFDVRDLLKLSSLSEVIAAGGGPVQLAIEERGQWPLPLDLPLIHPGLRASVRVSIEKEIERSPLPLPVRVRAAWAVEVEREK